MIFANFFDSFREIFFGSVFGFFFGFLLRKARVTRFDTIVGQLILQDFTVMKVIMSAILVASAGFYGLLELKVIPALSLTQYTPIATALGGGIFGIGMAILGYCPGTAIGALGEGSKDVLFGILGMLCGIVFYSILFPWIKSVIKITDEVPLTLPQILNVSPWVVISFLSAFVILFFYHMEKKR